MPQYADINLHPSSHLISQVQGDTFDVIRIGSGWVGRVLAARLAAAGLSAIIVERELVGGDCPFWACIPSKVLLRSGEVLSEASAVGGVKERLEVAKGLDVQAVFQRRDVFTAKWNDQAVLLVRGTGRITGEKEVTVQANEGQVKLLTARRAVVVCTGSEPIIPAVPGLSKATPWTPRQATSASKAPKSLIIVGAGAVGCEMATTYASFGTSVILISSGGRVLSQFEPAAGQLVQDSLLANGVQVYLSHSLIRVDRSNEGMVMAALKDGNMLEAEESLIATGRQPRTGDMGLDVFGLPSNGSPIPVDESLCVASVPGRWLYAAGDVNARHPLTHGSKYHGRIVANSILAGSQGEEQEAWGNASATADKLAMPQVVFTTPTVASAGLTKARAKEAGISCREVTAISRTLASSIYKDGATDGWAQWVVEETSGRLLGATLVGEGVGELLHAYTVAIAIQRLAHAVPPFPTMGEVHLNLLEAAGL